MVHRVLAVQEAQHQRTESCDLRRVIHLNSGIRCVTPIFGSTAAKLLTLPGLLILLNERAPMAHQIVFPLIAGIGLGMLFHAPYQVFTKALKPSEIATGTSAFFLVRFTGATVGLVSPLVTSNAVFALMLGAGGRRYHILYSFKT